MSWGDLGFPATLPRTSAAVAPLGAWPAQPQSLHTLGKPRAPSQAPSPSWMRRFVRAVCGFRALGASLGSAWALPKSSRVHLKRPCSGGLCCPFPTSQLLLRTQLLGFNIPKSADELRFLGHTLLPLGSFGAAKPRPTLLLRTRVPSPHTELRGSREPPQVWPSQEEKIIFSLVFCFFFFPPKLQLVNVSHEINPGKTQLD